MKIEDKKVVTMHYTLKDEKGDVLDKSKKDAPLAYLHGRGNIIPGLEAALLGKGAGEDVKAEVAPADAYGKRDEGLVKTTEVSNFKSPDEVKVGAQFRLQTKEGHRLATITKVEGEKVTVDMNHPLANQTLFFDVSILEIRDATEEELAHGHVHGPGGHHH